MFGPKSDDAVRREARRWSVRMHSDDAAGHREAFERWRAADPRHETAYARLEQQWGQARLLAQTQIGRARALPSARPTRSGAPLGYAVALALVVLALGLGLWTHAPGLFGDASRTTSEIASHVGEIRTLQLADGSRVTLDTDSAIRVALSPEARKIVLTRGRARFDVAHDADRPFIVHARNGTVTARGTIFDVSLLGDRVAVTLLRGIVDVRELDTPALSGPERPVVRLHPGQQTGFGASQPPAPPHAVSLAENRWISGMLSFDADPLGDALAQANRYSAAKISVADPTLNDLKITGAYHVRDAGAFAHALAVSLDLDVAPGPNGTIVLSRPTRSPPGG